MLRALRGSVWLGLLFLAGCGGAERTTPFLTAEAKTLGTTPGGSVYHVGNCRGDNDRGRLVTFSPGTGVSPLQSRQYVEHLGNATGLCVIALDYENDRLVASYCSTTETPSGPQDADCLEKVLGAKASSHPERVECVDGSVLEVPYSRSVEGAILEALTFLGMRNYLTSSGEVRWERLVLTGHSQGAQLSLFIALTRQAVSAVGSIGGGVLGTAGARPYPPFVYEARVTDPGRFRAFHHVDDEDSFRRDVYEAIGFSPQAIRTSRERSPECTRNPHSCVVVDPVLPMRDGKPVFLDDWKWLVESAE